MYIAEIRGKLSSKIEKSEDILTSNVLSFFKYSQRTVFLNEFLKHFRIFLDEDELYKAEFIFWPRYDDNTEPDVVIIAGDYYLLFEAKYFSGFGEKTEKRDSQLIREITMGMQEAQSIGKQFRLIAITADYNFDKKIFEELKDDYIKYLNWINWQRIALIIANLIEIHGEELPNYLFTKDLYELLQKKKLRNFIGFHNLKFENKADEYLFYKSETSKFRGGFIGFTKALDVFNEINSLNNKVFYESRYFYNLKITNIKSNNRIFYSRGKE